MLTSGDPILVWVLLWVLMHQVIRPEDANIYVSPSDSFDSNPHGTHRRGVAAGRTMSQLGTGLQWCGGGNEGA